MLISFSTLTFGKREGRCRRQPLYCGQNQPSCGALGTAARLTLLCWTSTVSTYIVVKTNQMVEHTTLRRTTLWLISTRPPFPRMYTVLMSNLPDTASASKVQFYQPTAMLSFLSRLQGRNRTDRKWTASVTVHIFFLRSFKSFLGSAYIYHAWHFHF